VIISGGFIDCVLNAAGNDINGQSYSDYSHHRWTITGSSGPIAGSNPINGTPVQATWTVTGYGHHASNTPGNASSWTRTGGPSPAPLVVYSSGNTVVLQRSGTLNSVMNGFKVQTGSTTQPGNVDEIGLVVCWVPTRSSRCRPGWSGVQVFKGLFLRLSSSCTSRPSAGGGYPDDFVSVECRPDRY